MNRQRVARALWPYVAVLALLAMVWLASAIGYWMTGVPG